MKKQLIIGVLAILVLVGLGWVLVGKTTPEKKISGLDWRNSAEWLPKTGGATTTEELVEPLAPLDYSKLTGKDRLYTEEEGKYENLSDAEKNLLRTVLTLPECIGKPKKVCSDNEWMIENSSLVALGKGYALLKIPNGKGGVNYKIYNLEQKKYVGESLFSFGAGIRNKNIIFLYDVNSINNIFYYRDGMGNFPKLPNSNLSNGETYANSDGFGPLVDGEITGDTLVLSVFVGQHLKTENKKIREVTFNINTLP